MKGDFTRVTFDPRKHYRGVLMQQGRVQLDADWNEQLDIQAHRVETETRDTLGLCGTPIDQPGFTLIADATVLSAAEQARLTSANLLPLQAGDFLIGPGRYYVNGILCENDDYVLYTRQPDRPSGPSSSDPNKPDLEIKPITEAGVYLAYLEAWTRHITALDDEAIREKALNGPDTTTRAKTIWQVKLKRAEVENPNCANMPAPSDDSTGQLSARSKPPDDEPGDCAVPASAGYRRLENQLYRVEIHAGGDKRSATFKWSRDNASMVTAWKSKNGNDLTVSSSGPDNVLGFESGQWIELSDDTRELQGQPGTLVRLVTAVGPILTIDPTTTTQPVELTDFPLNHKVRRWDTLVTSGGARPLTDTDTPDGFIRLEDGVEIKFEDGQYRTGDYWLIPARTATAEVEWPKDASNAPLPQPKHGIAHHTCSLGLLQFDAGTLTVAQDCRPRFPSLTDLMALHYVSGDGQEARPSEPLPYDLIVGVSNGRHPVPGAVVQFAVTGGGTVSAQRPQTDADGLARCRWTLGAGVPQQVVATLRDDNNQIIHLPVVFNAQFTQAEADEPGIHVQNIVYISTGERFHNDTEIGVDVFARGLGIVCNETVRHLSIETRSTSGDNAGVSPTVYVTLDLPYPFNRADQELWGGNSPVVAYQPLILSSGVDNESKVIRWIPTRDTYRWLVDRLFQTMQTLKRGERILAHLTLKGNFIWGQDTKQYLDGEVFGVEARGPTGARFVEAQLPSGDRRRGGDLEVWFWLVGPQPARPVVVLVNPARAPFKALLAARRQMLAKAVSLALNPAELRGLVPPEFEVNMNLPFDLPAARALVEQQKLQTLRFAVWSEMALMQANKAMALMLEQLSLSVQVEGVEDLPTALKTAVAAGNAPQAVLVDAAMADPLKKLGYTFEMVRL